MNAEQDRRQARLAALSDGQRKLVLAYLCGAVPETVDDAIDFLAEDMTAQTTEANDG